MKVNSNFLSMWFNFITIKDRWIDYQNDCRIYLDEYPEQEELRKKYFKDDPFIVSRFLIRK